MIHCNDRLLTWSGWCAAALAGSEALGRSAEAPEDSAVLGRSPAVLSGSDALGRSAAFLEGSRALGRCAAGLMGSEGGLSWGSDSTWLGLDGRVGLFRVTFSFLVGPPAALSAPGSGLCTQHTSVSTDDSACCGCKVNDRLHMLDMALMLSIT